MSHILKPRASLIVINEQQEILLMERYKGNRHYWVFPGGGVEDNETFEAAAIREAMEEVSLSIHCLSHTFTISNEGREEQFFVAIDFSGEVKLGIGPERGKSSPTNTYSPSWIAINKLCELNLFPIEGKRALLDQYLRSVL